MTRLTADAQHTGSQTTTAMQEVRELREKLAESNGRKQQQEDVLRSEIRSKQQQEDVLRSEIRCQASLVEQLRYSLK